MIIQGRIAPSTPIGLLSGFEPDAQGAVEKFFLRVRPAVLRRSATVRARGLSNSLLTPIYRIGARENAPFPFAIPSARFPHASNERHSGLSPEQQAALAATQKTHS